MAVNAGRFFLSKEKRNTSSVNLCFIGPARLGWLRRVNTGGLRFFGGGVLTAVLKVLDARSGARPALSTATNPRGFSWTCKSPALLASLFVIVWQFDETTSY